MATIGRLADVIASEGAERNWDDETQAQQRQIEDEIANAQALVGEKRQFTELQAEYNDAESAAFLHKAKDLCEKYSHWRRVRGDGNCFYRATAFAVCERFLLANSPPAGEYERFVNLATGWKKRLFKLGFPDMTTEDFCDVTCNDIIQKLQDKDMDEAKLVGIFNSRDESNYITVFMRLVTAGYLLENEKTYEGFIDGGRSMKEFVDQEVNPMFRECDHLCIMALSKGLNIPLRIEYMDRTQAPSGGWHHDFTPDSEDGQSVQPLVHFLYRPGHYDILYPKQ